MTHHQVRLDQYKDFNPETSKWRDDKRSYERATGGFQVLVAKNYSTLGIPCVAIYPDIDKGRFVGCKVAAPEGPLKAYFDQDDTKRIFFDLLQEAFIDALEKKEKKRNGEEVRTSTMETRTVGFVQPPRPIWILTLKELETYFSGMKTQLAVEDKVKIRRKWPKIENGKAIKLPTKIPLLDEIAEKILPSDSFIPGQKFPHGNLQWRLKLVCAYIMLKYDKNPNTFATEVPDDYQEKLFTLKDLKEFSKDVDQFANQLQGKKRKKNDDVEHHVAFYEQNDDTNFDYEASETESEDGNEVFQSSPAPTITTFSPNRPTDSNPGQSGVSRSSPPRQEQPPSSRTQPFAPNSDNQMQTLFEGMVAVSTPMPADVFFDIDELGLDTSRQTGTPINSEVGDEDTDEEAMMARLEDEINDRDEIKNLMEHTDLRKVLGGQECENPVLQIFNFEKLSRAKCYRAHGQDGNIASSKISFSANINDRVEEFDNKYPILSITSYQLYNGSFLFIRDFEVLRILDNLEGTPEYLTEKDYDEMKAHLKANDNLPQTPSMVIRKLSNKNVDELNARPISTSQRLKNRSVGSSV